MGPSHTPAGHSATVEWIAEDLNDGPAQFTFLNGYLVSSDRTTDSATDLLGRWAISVEGTLIARGASATIEGARGVAIDAARSMAPNRAA